MNKYLQNAAVEHLPPSPAIHGRAMMLPYGDKFLYAAIGAALVVLGVSYLIELNVVAAKGFSLRTTERNVAALKERQKKLQIELSQKESLVGLSGEIERIGMVPIQKIEYVRVSKAAVAVK